MGDRLIPAKNISEPAIRNAFLAYRQSMIPFQQIAFPGQRFVSLERFLDERPVQAFSYELFARGLKTLGGSLSQLTDESLPFSRCMVGVDDPTKDNFGGFHSPDHGYRHLEQLSVVSVLGAFATERHIDSDLRALDLLRAVAHDSVHHCSHRIYRIRRDACLDGRPLSEVAYRWQYGINFRRPDGVSYSGRDSPSTKTTRNLGIIMDAVTDQFAASVVRTFVSHVSHAAQGPNHTTEHLESFVKLDVCNEFSESHIETLRQLLQELATSADVPPEEHRYLNSIRQFQRYVVLRWKTFCAELSQPCDGDLYDAVLAAILTGRLRELSELLNALTNSRSAFRDLFRQTRFKVQQREI